MDHCLNVPQRKKKKGTIKRESHTTARVPVFPSFEIVAVSQLSKSDPVVFISDEVSVGKGCAAIATD